MSILAQIKEKLQPPNTTFTAKQIKLSPRAWHAIQTDIELATGFRPAQPAPIQGVELEVLTYDVWQQMNFSYDAKVIWIIWENQFYGG